MVFLSILTIPGSPSSKSRPCPFAHPPTEDPRNSRRPLSKSHIPTSEPSRRFKRGNEVSRKNLGGLLRVILLKEACCGKNLLILFFYGVPEFWVLPMGWLGGFMVWRKKHMSTVTRKPKEMRSQDSTFFEGKMGIDESWENQRV